jgi:hypothetical protein
VFAPLLLFAVLAEPPEPLPPHTREWDFGRGFVLEREDLLQWPGAQLPGLYPDATRPQASHRTTLHFGAHFRLEFLSHVARADSFSPVPTYTSMQYGARIPTKLGVFGVGGTLEFVDFSCLSRDAAPSMGGRPRHAMMVTFGDGF